MNNENKNETQWVKDEIQQIEENRKDFGDSLHMEENKITIFEVDFTHPFEEWIDTSTGTIKKIIPVVHEGEQKKMWLNTRNPLYTELLKRFDETGQTLFKVLRTGQQKDTKFNLLED